MRPDERPLYDIFEEVSKERSKAKRADILRAHNSLHMRDVLRAAFDDTIIFDLPEGTPPFTPNEQFLKENVVGSLRKGTKMLTYVIKGSPMAKNLRALKKEKMWVDLLENCHPNDAKVLSAMKDKQLTGLFKGLTKELVKEVYPKLIRK